MRPNTSLESGVCAMLMMALQEGHTPLASNVMADVLGVSDSYLKKTLRKLTVAGLVVSSAQRGGGFMLAREPGEISVADAFRVLCGSLTPELSALPDRVFPDKAHTAQVKALLSSAMSDAEGAYLDRLGDVHLSDLLDTEKAAKGAVDWAAVAARIPAIREG